MSKDMIKAAYYKGNKSFGLDAGQLHQPSADEVQIQVAYCGICGTDMHVFHGNMDARVGLNRIIGHEMSGRITAVGARAGDISVGQKVTVRPLDNCNDCPACDAGYKHICHNLKFLGLDTHGALQSYWNVPKKLVHNLPDSIRLDHAALIEPIAVACHDVRLAELKKGETAVVIGGGPIGILVALVARSEGAEVVISEVNPNRLAIAQQLGFEVVNPREINLADKIDSLTNNKGADVVFEVSGTQQGVDTMTQIASARGRIVMVAIHAKKPEIDLFQFFWRELKLIGARVYEEIDFEKAIDIVDSGVIDIETIITNVVPLKKIQSAFEELDRNPTAMKSLIEVNN